VREHCLAALGYYAFRCRECQERFLERPMDLASVVYAKCPHCLRMDLSTWDPKYYRVGWWTKLRLWFGAHRWRCEPCRRNFVSWRMRKERYVRAEAGQSGAAAGKE
jgi:hypothetical protein